MKIQSIRVLVTGAGSGVGQSITKALKLSKLNLKIISADISVFQAGLFRYDESIIIPKVEVKNSLKWFLKNLKAKKIDVLFVGSEFEIGFFSRNKKIIEKKTGVQICVSPYKTIKIAADKYLTANFLKNNGLPYSKTFVPKNLAHAKKIINQCKMPIYLKNRLGTSSRNVLLIYNKKDLTKNYHNVNNPMIQEFAGYQGSDLKRIYEEYAGYIGSDLQYEYTCSVFFTKEKDLIGPFVARRKLRGGTSWLIEIKKFDFIKPLLIRIAKLLPSVGSLNIQLRDGKNGPVPFEFNARFSGTTCIRAHYGFNEPEMFIKNYFLKKKITTPKIKKGVALRYVEEIFLDNVNQDNKNILSTKGKKENWF